MGLLEKALQYKKEINSRGGQTLIDKIQGPAETDILESVDDEKALKDDSLHQEVRRPAEMLERQDLGSDDDLFSLPADPVPSRRADTLPKNMGFMPDIDPERTKDTLASRDPNNNNPMTAEDEPPVLLKKRDLHGLAANGSDEGITETRDSGAEQATKPIAMAADGVDRVPDHPLPDAPLPEAEDAEDSLSLEIESGPAAARAETRPPESSAAYGYGEARAEEAISAHDAKDGLPSPEPRENTRFDQEKFRTELPERIGQTTRHNKKFHDFMVLYEIGKEIVRAETRLELYDVILFSVMGQIGTSSASIIVPDEKDPLTWTIADSRGIVLKNRTMAFRSESGILSGIIGKRDIVDLDEYKNTPEFEEEYYKLISVDARLVCPLTADGKTLGAVVVGEKITIGDYTEAEKDFMVSIAEIAAMVFRKISALEELQKFSNSYREDISLNSTIGELMNRIAQCTSMETASGLIQEEISRLGLISYALFMRNEKNDEFVPVLTEREDRAGLIEHKFSVPLEHPLVSYMLEMREGTRIGGFSELPVIRNSFPESILKRMTQLWIFPYKSGGMMLGFMYVFRLEDREFPEGLHLHLDRLSKLLISYMINMRSLGPQHVRYTDAIDPVIRRLQKSFDNARDLGIPFTLIMLSIKNFKRYYSLYGHEDAASLVKQCEDTIAARLSDTDYALRIERNKILIALPGKNKKFAITLANTIRNEISMHFRKKEMQLMLMYLTAEYPEDGDDLYALLDGIE